VTLEHYVSDVFSNKSIKILMAMIIIISMVLQSQTSFFLCTFQRMQTQNT
jgi:hypothetical protein